MNALLLVLYNTHPHATMSAGLIVNNQGWYAFDQERPLAVIFQFT